jgi:hypothetical protein
MTPYSANDLLRSMTHAHGPLNEAAFEVEVWEPDIHLKRLMRWVCRITFFL